MTMVDAEPSWFQNSDALIREMRSGKVRASTIPSLDDYDNIQPLGRGGQGDVFVATHRELGRRVAIKVLRRGAWRSEAAERRFEREIETVAGLQHSNIVRIYESGVTEDDRRFYSMEHIEGAPLNVFMSQASADGPPLTLRQRLEIFVKVADAVAFAHQNGVIHRDLKPANILIDAAGEPHLLDFGLATWVTGSATLLMTMTGEFLGTLSYAAPEQVGAQSKTMDVRTDVYALGVILYELLTNQPLVPPQLTLADAVRAISEAEPRPPSRVSPTESSSDTAFVIDRDLDAIVLKTLSKRPSERYDTAAALRDDVTRYLNSEPIAARRLSGWYLISKWIRRHRLAATAAAIVVATLIGSTAILTLLYRRATTEAAKARQIKVFLEDTLGSVSPEKAGAPVVLSDVLDEAVHWVDIALEDQPEVAASIRMTIGNSFRSLGAYEKSERELLAALNIRRDLFGPSHADIATSLNAIALLRRDQGALDKAAALFDEVLEMRRRELGPDTLGVAQASQNLGILNLMQDDTDSAAKNLFLARAIRNERLGSDHPDTLMCQYQIGRLLAQSGDREAAEKQHASVLESRLRQLHPNHPDIARSHRALGDLAMQDEEYSVAADQFAACYALLKNNKGCQNESVAAAADAQAAALRAAGDHDSASSVLRAHEACAAAHGN